MRTVIPLLLMTASTSWGFGMQSITRANPLTTMWGASTPNKEHLTFDGMKRLAKRLKVLEESSPGFLMDFYDPQLFSFSIAPGTAERISITSTCYAIRAMMASEYAAPYKDVDLGRVLAELLNSPWREDDVYQMSLMLVVILRSDPKRVWIKEFDEETTSNLSRLISLVLAARPKRRHGEDQGFSDYISYLCATSYSLLLDTTGYDDSGSLLIGGLPTEVASVGISKLSLAVTRAAETSFNELCRQMAYRSANDSTRFDPTRLAFSLLSYIRSTESIQGTAGRTILYGDGVHKESNPVNMNKRLVRAGLAALFEEQHEDGLWDRGQPIYRSFRRQGRNVGNAYVFAVDTIASLLEVLPAEEFRPHLWRLQRMLQWIESHQSVEVIPDYCDEVSGRCFGKPLRGWASPHLTPGTGPRAWSTAQTATSISRVRRVVKQLMHNDVLDEFQGISHSQFGPKPEAWERLLDSDLGSPATGCKTIKKVLSERVCTPFANSITNPSYGAAYSAILFGSPGTAKTTICEAVAEKMGWDFVVIDTAAFLADGLTNVASRIRYVFTRLQALRKCVILFDEIEEFCLNRETPGLSMESRMLTTAMLTAINDLRRTKQSIFFLATNRLRAFDAAIIRPGRFDVQLFVGTPNLEARVVLFEQALTRVHASFQAKENAMELYRNFLESVWSADGDAMFMNYLEGKQFATSAAHIVSDGRELGDEELQILLDQQAAVMTCRGAVRDEYKAQMELSRL